MKKLFRNCLALAALLVAFGAQAQQPGQMMPEMHPLPADSAVRIGTLPNGLTYYIRHNETPKGQADFYIAQKVGSILEDDNQRGLAHFLEHMCFNGTENFPGKGIIEWLESVGVKFGRNLNAYTSIDETVYNISSVPVARQSVQDSCLLILHDWASALTLDPAEIDAERGVIHEEWRRSMAGQMRILENILPTIYPNNKYGYRLPIGTMEVVDNFPPQAIRDYYHKWYRPDQQGIIVVGDIDPDYIEAKIKEIFTPIPMPENAAERYYVPVEDTPGTIYAIGSDPEQQMGLVAMMFKYDLPFPTEARNTAEYMTYKYVSDVVQKMLQSRLDDMAATPDAPFAYASVKFDDFLLASTKQALELDVIAKGNDPLPALQAAYREVLRAVRGGFTQSEYDRASAAIRSEYQKKFDTRANTPNEDFSRKYVRAFVDNDPIPVIDLEKQIIDGTSYAMPLQIINSFLPEIVTADNRVVMAALPQNDTFRVPAEADFAAVVTAVEAENIEPYKEEVKAEPLIPELPAPGTVASQKHLDSWDATEYTLSNGVKVVVKPTTFKDNEIRFVARARGGFSVEPESSAANIIFLNTANQFSELGLVGLGSYTNSDLKKYLSGKQIEISLKLDDYDRTLEGSTVKADLPVLMELIHAYFTEYNLSPDEFTAAQNMANGLLGNQESTPDFAFSKLIRSTLYAAKAEQMITTDIINAADCAGTTDFVKRMLANPAEFTFYFAGSIDPDTFLPLVEKYLANLPVGGQAVTYTSNPAFEAVLGNNTTQESMAMQTPQTWVFYLIDGPVDYTPANKAIASIAAQIMSKRLLNKVREEMGATYSIGAYGGLQRLGHNNLMIQIPFPMKPEMKDEALAAIDTIIAEMATNVTDAELAPVKEFMVKDAREQLEKNEDWVEAMAATELNGVATFLNAEQTAAAVTTADVMNFWKKVLEGNNRQLIILNPAQ